MPALSTAHQCHLPQMHPTERGRAPNLHSRAAPIRLWLIQRECHLRPHSELYIYDETYYEEPVGAGPRACPLNGTSMPFTTDAPN